MSAEKRMAAIRRETGKSGTVVSGNTANRVTASAAIYKPGRKTGDHKNDRRTIARPWQIEAYRHVNICGEARYAATLFASIAGRAEIGISEPQALAGKANWVNKGPEVDALAVLLPTVRDRTKFIQDYTTHMQIAGECYLVGRVRQDTDPDPGHNGPIWEIVGATELRRVGTGDSEYWEVRFDNDNWVALSKSEPVVRMWNPDPENRREAWSPFRSLLPTLREIEWLTKHIFTQVRSRLMSAGNWFLPEGMTFAPPPADAVEGGEEAIAAMNEAEQFMVSLATASMALLDDDEVAMPNIIMANEEALAQVSQDKLIKMWSEIDDKAMLLRADAVRRFALGMNLPPEQILGSTGMAVSGSSGSAGSGSSHWSVWAQEEQTITNHIEPALDKLAHTLTTSFLRPAVPGTRLVVSYDATTLRLRQDRSKEAIELYDRGLLSGDVTLREVGFDPQGDRMTDEEYKRWLLARLAQGSATPEQVQAAFALLGVALPVVETSRGAAPQMPGGAQPRSLEGHPYEGPPREDHYHNPAPYALNPGPDVAQVGTIASCEVLALRALEKFGNRLLNDGKRGREKDRTTPVLMAHVIVTPETPVEPSAFDVALADVVFGDKPAAWREPRQKCIQRFCADLVNSGTPYTRAGLVEALEGLI